MHCTHVLISLTKSLTNSLSDFSLNILKILPINDFPGWSFRPPQTPQEVDSFLLFFSLTWQKLASEIVLYSSGVPAFSSWNSFSFPSSKGFWSHGDKRLLWSMGLLRSITPYNGREDLEQVKQERGTQLCINRKVLPIAKINYAQFVTRKSKSSTYWQ